MIIDCIGCLHGYYPQLKGGDLLIVTGDLTASDKSFQYIEFYKWLEKQEYRKKIVIPGNHDNYFQKCNTFSPAPFADELATYLCDSGTEFEGLKIWASPWTKKFEGQNPKAMAFCLDTDEELEEKWKLIPDDIDILITHGPPYGILDKTEKNKHVGCRRLREHVIGRVKPKLHIFSHIHERGAREIYFVTTKFINCSIMNERYKPVNKPARIQL